MSGVLERLPERFKTRAFGRALFSPSATLLAGAGVSAAVLAGAPLAAAAVVGAACWLGRVALAVPRTPADQRVDPSRVTEPWRTFVVDALQARRRFDTACRRARPGPLQEHLVDLGRRLDTAVAECWRVARQGDALEGALSDLDVEGAERELDELRREPPSPSRDRAEQAVQAQVATAQRLARVAGDARDRLRVLNAQVDEAVARAVELSLSSGDSSDLSPVSDQVDSLVGEMEALRQALEETSGRPATAPGGGA